MRLSWCITLISRYSVKQFFNETRSVCSVLSLSLCCNYKNVSFEIDFRINLFFLIYVGRSPFCKSQLIWSKNVRWGSSPSNGPIHTQLKHLFRKFSFIHSLSFRMKSTHGNPHIINSVFMKKRTGLVLIKANIGWLERHGILSWLVLIQIIWIHKSTVSLFRFQNWI